MGLQHSSLPLINQFSQFCRVAQDQLAPQVFQFKSQLSAGSRDLFRLTCCRDLAAIDAVTAPFGFGMNCREIGSNTGQGINQFAKARQLWMMAVTTGLSAQDFLRQQGFAPQREQSHAVEIARMQCP